MDIRDALRRFDIKPRKSLGQNFLFDPAVLDRIVRAGDVGADDIVLEIGPGAGSLTRALAASARQVIAVELDRRLLPVLEYTLGGLTNVRIVQGDILTTNVSALIPEPVQPFKVVANIPYYITSAVIRHLLESPVAPGLIVLTVQREVAERICAQPPEMSLLAVSVQIYGEARVVGHIPAGAFYPAPEVDSAIVRIAPFTQSRLTGMASDEFFEIVKAGFSQRRKQLRNALGGGLRVSHAQADAWLAGAGIEPARRAETLSVEDWLALGRRIRLTAGLSRA
jgi:16S rRNA (adenine1518-N6/adenine1519-N6)-dimethyltransferase